jgi:hypothetical protein
LVGPLDDDACDAVFNRKLIFPLLPERRNYVVDKVVGAKSHLGASGEHDLPRLAVSGERGQRYE